MNQSIVATDISGLGNLIAHFTNLPDFAPTTQDTYRRALRQWAGWVNEGGSPGDVRAFKAHLHDAGLSPFTVGVYLTALRRFYAWAVEQGLAQSNPAASIKGEKKPRGHLRDNMTENEAARVLRLVDRDTVAGKRDYALIYMLARCGLRLIEVHRADVEDIRTKDGAKVLFLQGKGRTAKDDFVLLVGPTYETVMDYLTARGAQPGSPLFVGEGNRGRGRRMTTRALRERVNHYLALAGIKTKTITAHSFRHSAITWAIQHGANPIAVQHMARHTSFDTTQLYYHETKRTGDEAAERFVPELT